MGSGIQNTGWQQLKSSTNPLSLNQVCSPVTHIWPHFGLSQNCLPCKPSFRVSFWKSATHSPFLQECLVSWTDSLGMTFDHDQKAMVKAHRCCIRLPHLSSGGLGFP